MVSADKVVVSPQSKAGELGKESHHDLRDPGVPPRFLLRPDPSPSSGRAPEYGTISRIARFLREADFLGWKTWFIFLILNDFLLDVLFLVVNSVLKNRVSHSLVVRPVRGGEVEGSNPSTRTISSTISCM